MEVLFEDNDVIVIVKEVGVDSEKISYSDIFPLKSHPLFVVHRLDKLVSGVMVLAKNERSAANLSKQIVDGTFKKTYLAICSNRMEENEGVMEDYLFFDRNKNKSYVVPSLRKGVKLASLDYKVLKEKDDLSLVEVHLHTGRTHQIRVQFANRKHPLYADRRYGSNIKDNNIGLFSYRISFIHPINKKEVTFIKEPLTHPFDIF